VSPRNAISDTNAAVSYVCAGGAAMNFSDCKFFFVIAVVGIIVYAIAYPWNWSRYPWQHREVPRPKYIIVPKDYPGARPLDEIKDR
jgi:hypothetical protein